MNRDRAHHLICSLQHILGVRVDGILGPVTLTALERAGVVAARHRSLASCWDPYTDDARRPLESRAADEWVVCVPARELRHALAVPGAWVPRQPQTTPEGK